LARNDHKLLDINLHLANELHWSDWKKVDRLTHERRSITESIATERQKNKFEALTQHNRQPDLVDAPPEDRQRRTIVNLTQKELSADEKSVLSKGGNFAIVPAKLLLDEIIANVESGIWSLPIHTAEHIRAETYSCSEQSPRKAISLFLSIPLFAKLGWFSHTVVQVFFQTTFRMVSCFEFD